MNQVQIKHIAIAVGILILALVGHAYYVTSMNMGKLDQLKADLKPVHVEAAQERVTATKAEDLNQRTLALTLAAIAAQKQQPIASQVDYDRIAQMIQARMGAPAIVQATTTPDAPSATVSAKSLNAYMSDCDQKDAFLKSCRQTVADTQALLVAEVKDHAADKKELDQTKLSLKGGSFFHRVKTNGKWMTAGAVVGTVATVIVIKKRSVK